LRCKKRLKRLGRFEVVIRWLLDKARLPALSERFELGIWFPQKYLSQGLGIVVSICIIVLTFDTTSKPSCLHAKIS